MLRVFKSAMLLGALAVAAVAVSPTNADACAGLIGSNGAVNLGSTTTLAAYHEGVEHYVTAFEFQGGGGQFGTLIPLPGVPTKVERGGAWTLQRLAAGDPAQGARRSVPVADAASAAGAEVLATTPHRRSRHHHPQGRRRRRRGLGGAATASASRRTRRKCSTSTLSAARFFSRPCSTAKLRLSAASALGDGTPVHLTIPTDNPWVPLRILGLGKQANDRVEADVFLLTEAKPTCCPANATASTCCTTRRPRRACSTTCAPMPAWSGCRPLPG